MGKLTRKYWGKFVGLLLIVTLLLTMVFPATSVYAKISKPSGLKAHHAFVAIDARTGQVLMGDKENQKVYPASTTKLMTAIVLVKKCKMTKKVKITKKMLKTLPSGMSNYGLKAGDSYTMETLLNMILIPSAGDAAYCAAVASYGSVKKFVKAMNDEAKSLGLSHTSFENPAGLDIGNGFNNHYTTAYEMALITRAAMTYPEIREIVARKSYQVKKTNGKKGRIIYSTNRFYSEVSYPTESYRVIGSKTGTTNAAGCVFTATIVDKKGHQIICTYMGKESHVQTCEDIKKIIKKLLDQNKKKKLKLSTGEAEIVVDQQEYNFEQMENQTFSISGKIKDKTTGYVLKKNLKGVSFESDNPEIAQVDKNGNVTILGEGQVIIRMIYPGNAYYSGIINEIKISVNVDFSKAA